MYAIHPATVHFPIALLLLNLLLTLKYLREADPFTERAAYGALILGWWATLAAAVTGTIATALEWPLEEGVLGWLNGHAALGFALLAIYGRALLWRRREPNILQGARRRPYLLLLVTGAVVVVIDGWLGGRLVYQYGVGIR